MHSLFVWTTLPRPFFSNSLSTLPPCLLSVSLNCFILIRDSWIKAAGQFWIHVTLACLANKQQEGEMGVNAMSTSAWLNCPFPCLQTTYKREDLRFIFLSTELILSKPTKKSKHSHPFNKCRFVLMCEIFFITGTFDIILCVDVNETTAGQAKSRKEALIPELKKNGMRWFVIGGSG